MDYVSFRTAFDALLRTSLESRIAHMRDAVGDPLLADMIAHIGPLVLTGGKRIRPYFAALLYQGLGGEDADTIGEVTVGIELFHSFALVHDDIMDGAPARHGVESAHGRVTSLLQGRPPIRGDAKRVGEAQAILLGDLLHAWAHDGFAVGIARCPRLHDVIRTMEEEVLMGQMIDMNIATKHRVSSADIERKNLLKTARYSFVRPLQIGAVLADASDDVLRWCQEFGECVGLAYQVQDDLLDLISTEEVLGKAPLSDLRDGQHTVYTQWIFDHGTPEQQSLLEAMLHAPLGASDQERVVALLEESGARAHGQAVAAQHWDKSEALLLQSPLPSGTLQSLRETVVRLRSRLA